jgi:histidinol phosphatase-like enzyme
LGHALEKPNATAYYQRAVDQLILNDSTSNQLKNQVRNLRNRYTKAVEWMNQMGQGVLEIEGEDSVKRKPLIQEPITMIGIKLQIGL